MAILHALLAVKAHKSAPLRMTYVCMWNKVRLHQHFYVFMHELWCKQGMSVNRKWTVGCLVAEKSTEKEKQQGCFFFFLGTTTRWNWCWKEHVRPSGQRKNRLGSHMDMYIVILKNKIKNKETIIIFPKSSDYDASLEISN